MDIRLYYNIVEYKMKSIGINSAMYFPQFDQIFIPHDLNTKAVLIHEKMHAHFFCNTYGFIIRDFFQIIQNLKDHIIERLRGAIDNIVDPNNSVESQILDIDEALSMDDNLVDILCFYIKMHKKYKILINNTKIAQEGIACYFSSKAADLSENERNQIIKTINENEFYNRAYKKIEQLEYKWGNCFEDILNVIFMVPYYNYDIVGMRLDEFVDISKFIYCPDQRLEFLLYCSLEEENQIRNILANKNYIVDDLKIKKGEDNIYHKFPSELIEDAYMLNIHKIMHINTPNYKRPFENAYIKMENGELNDLVDTAPDFFRSLEYVKIEHAAMHKQVEDVFRRLGVKNKPLHYDYEPSLSRNYFLYARAKDDHMLVDRLLSIMLERKDEDLLTVESANELIDIDNFYLRAEAICKKWRDRFMTNTFEIWGKPDVLKPLEIMLYLNDFTILQSCNTSSDDGYNSPEIIDIVSKIVVAVGGSTGILLGIAEIIKASKMAISIDLEKKKIDITNASYEQVKELFKNIVEKINHDENNE